MKKILKYLCLGGSLFYIFQKFVSASSEFILESDPNSITYKIKTEKKTKQLYFFLVKDKETKELVYCLEPGVNLSKDAYEELKDGEYQKLNLTQEQKNFVTKVAYFGYGYQNHQDLSYYYAAQLLIWKKIIPASWDIYYTDSLGGEKIEIYQKEQEEILNEIKMDETLPSFANQSITWNGTKTLTLKDSNNQLHNYHLKTQTDWTITQIDNTLKIKSTSKGNVKLEFEKNYEGEPLKFYWREDGQNIMKRGKLSSKHWECTLNPYLLEIQIEKTDEEKNPIESVEFELFAKEEIKNNQNQTKIKKNEVVATLITDSKGKTSLSGLEPGAYCIKETKAPSSYQMEQTPICFTLSKENQVQKINVINPKKKENLIIYKKDADTNEPLEQVYFRITNDQNKVIWEGFTDKEGKIELNLPVGTYQITEILSQVGYIKETTPTIITLGGKESETEIVLHNHKKTQTLILQKEDEETKERLKGVEFRITDKVGKLIFQGKTDDEGKIEIQNLSYGTYKITELETLSGYELEKNPVTFEIDGTEKVKIITLTNRKIHSVPETKEQSKFQKIHYIPRKRRRT